MVFGGHGFSRAEGPSSELSFRAKPGERECVLQASRGILGFERTVKPKILRLALPSPDHPSKPKSGLLGTPASSGRASLGMTIRSGLGCGAAEAAPLRKRRRETPPGQPAR